MRECECESANAKKCKCESANARVRMQECECESANASECECESALKSLLQKASNKFYYNHIYDALRSHVSAVMLYVPRYYHMQQRTVLLPCWCNTSTIDIL